MEDDYIPIVVNRMIDSADVVIFSKSNSSICSEAMKIFDLLGQKYISKEVDTMKSAADIMDYLAQLTGVRTVPRIFIKGKSYGGINDLIKLYRTGELVKILK